MGVRQSTAQTQPGPQLAESSASPGTAQITQRHCSRKTTEPTDPRDNPKALSNETTASGNAVSAVKPRGALRAPVGTRPGTTAERARGRGRNSPRLRSGEEALTAGPLRPEPRAAPGERRSAATRTCPQRAPPTPLVPFLRSGAGTLRRRPQPHPRPRYGRSAAAPLPRWMSGAGPAAPSAARTAARRDEGRAAPGAPP